MTKEISEEDMRKLLEENRGFKLGIFLIGLVRLLIQLNFLILIIIGSIAAYKFLWGYIF